MVYMSFERKVQEDGKVQVQEDGKLQEDGKMKGTMKEKMNVKPEMEEELVCQGMMIGNRETMKMMDKRMKERVYG